MSLSLSQLSYEQYTSLRGSFNKLVFGKHFIVYLLMLFILFEID